MREVKEVKLKCNMKGSVKKSNQTNQQNQKKNAKRKEK